jgi:glycosyltransferase involved in cell wall biosynthesis
MIQQSDLLAISFSAYNRGAILLENLRKMLPEISRHSIPVYISDDSSDDETCRTAQLLRDSYPFIHYQRNPTRLGHDRNVLAALARPDSRYVWYLGDSMSFEEGTLDAIVSALSGEPDFIFINSHGQRACHPNGPVKDPRAFLTGMAWHLTLTGATIYARRCVDWMISHSRFAEKYPNFLQLGLIFEFLAVTDGRITWIQDGEVNPHAGKTTYWRNNAVQVFARDWALAIEAAPLFDESAKAAIIRSHSLHTGIFGIRNLLAMRGDEAFSMDQLRQYRREIRLAFRTPLWVAWIIARVPQGFAAFLVEHAKRLRNGLRGWTRATAEIEAK